jgi:hypothetical protein
MPIKTLNNLACLLSGLIRILYLYDIRSSINKQLHKTTIEFIDGLIESLAGYCITGDTPYRQPLYSTRQPFEFYKIDVNKTRSILGKLITRLNSVYSNLQRHYLVIRVELFNQYINPLAQIDRQLNAHSQQVRKANIKLVKWWRTINR